MSKTINKFYIRTRNSFTNKVTLLDVQFDELESFLSLPDTRYYRTIKHDSDLLQVNTIIFDCEVMVGEVLMQYTLTYESTTIKWEVM